MRKNRSFIGSIGLYLIIFFSNGFASGNTVDIFEVNPTGSNSPDALLKEINSSVLRKVFDLRSDVKIEIWVDDRDPVGFLKAKVDPKTYSSQALCLYVRLRFMGHSQAFAFSVVSRLAALREEEGSGKSVVTVNLFDVFDKIWVSNLISDEKEVERGESRGRYVFEVHDIDVSWQYIIVRGHSAEEADSVQMHRIDPVRGSPAFREIYNALRREYGQQKGEALQDDETKRKFYKELVKRIESKGIKWKKPREFHHTFRIGSAVLPGSFRFERTKE